ncbi:MAG: 30S ribosomal protein S12 methylthiotransferase RimO [Candidatus Aminicenantes bacterium]|nr:30S ribosomal protein S12 methylthiotransferase RimO [Candidatus Aminicenantes bacterium]
MRVAFISLGCAKALVDTEIMMGILSEKGHEITSSLESANVVVVNTCSFIDLAREETEQTVRDILKKGKKVIMVGCYVNRFREILKKKFPGLHLVLSTEEITFIEDALYGKEPVFKGYFLPSSRTPRLISTPPSWAYLKISEGCSRGCTFCTIPSIRGPYRSREIEDIAEEARRLEEQGRLEINIISQDTTFFGGDRGRKDLKALLEEVLSKTKKSWIRLLYLYPSETLLEILPLFSEKRLVPYFEIPLQHASKKVLKSMGRPWDGEKYLEIIETIRENVKEATIRTSLIVGFPTEGKREFLELLRWVERAKVDRLGVFTYSREKGTSAYALGDRVTKREKQRRAEEIIEIQKNIIAEKHEKMVGRIFDVLVEGQTPEGVYFGRSVHFAPEVDGGIYITGKAIPNKFNKVKITHSILYDLEGEPV